MYVRNPTDRVEKVAPFLTADTDPYPAVVDGRITWIVDGYTTLANYPYAEQMSLGDATADGPAGRAGRLPDEDDQLHPQLGEGHRRRLRRHRHAVRASTRPTRCCKTW